MDESDIEKIEDMFKHHIGILHEDFQHKLDLVVEGQQMLSEQMERMGNRLDGRIDGVDARLTRVEVKLDGVAADLSAHRADTEAHAKGYCVRKE